MILFDVEFYLRILKLCPRPWMSVLGHEWVIPFPMTQYILEVNNVGYHAKNNQKPSPLWGIQYEGEKHYMYGPY